ncbi:TonB-dependent receptor [Cellvibrio fibrivorans]|uniref:TonB-dependent receptor n=1 Tax=Cellvibrio fibrivorans TaxID=126350 RepID=A0ABU1US93_9GAMM|nr:TonB-dependent receptor [Cellvibrio fibrivorans]MDR7088043.1 TonB-dependent receptor [Cellvibrio fibrivorans]
MKKTVSISKNKNFVKTALAVVVAGLAGTVLADGRIEGQIKATEQGIALQGAKIRILELNREAVSQRDGRFVFLDVKAGNYTLVTSYIGADDIKRSVVVQDQQTTRENFQLVGVSGLVENVIVIGQAAGINKSLNKQRSADNILTAVSADAIGQFPDTNVSESLQRLPGLSIERDQGEGRYVRVRGMGPDYNAVTINGVGVPGPDADRRAVALDVIPSDLLENLTVTKSLTPDMDANSLGGSIDVQSLSAFDRDGFFYQLTAEGSYDENTEETSPKVAATASNQFSLGGDDNNLGVAFGVSSFKREFGSDNVETGGAWDFEDGEARLEEMEQRDYRITRERSGVTLNLDYKPSDDTDLYWRNLYSEYTDSEIRLANVIEFEDALAEGEVGSAEVQRELKDRTETQKILSTSLGGQTRLDKWTVDYRVAYSKSSEDEPQNVAGAVFKIDDDVIADEAFDLSYTNTGKILISAPAEYYQSASYKLDEVELGSTNTNDESTAINMDFTRDLELAGNSAQLKFGVKHAEREKDNNVDIWIAEDFTGDTSLTEFSASEVDYQLGQFGSTINAAQVKSAIEDAEEDEVESSIGDYLITEDTSAAYVMGRVDINDWRILTGVRYENTDFTAQGNSYDGDADELNAQSFENSDDYFLPALHIRYSISDKTQVRAAWTNSVVRPGFAQLSPGRLIEEDDGDIEAEFGNPDLKSLESSNIDFGIEHYPGVASVISAFAFYKAIDNFVYQTDLGGTAGYEDFDKAVTFVNGDKADILGLELAASKQFTSLPSPWDGLLIGGNATFVDSTAEIGGYDDGEFVARDIPMPSQSDTSANFMIGYESDKISMRLSANYKSNYLLEVLEPMEVDYDAYVDDQMQLDFSLRYYLTESIKLHFEALNLTDEVYYSYVKDTQYNAQYESYGATYKLGITFMQF